MFENELVGEILKRYRRIWALSHVSALAEWDSDVMMPKGGSSLRGEAFAELAVLKQRFITDSSFVELVRRASREELNDYERGVIRILERSIHYYSSLPSEFVAEEERVIEAAKRAWEEAKQKSEFSIFRPHLERIFELQRKKAEYLGYDEHPYDALVDLYEEGATKRFLDRFFSVLVPEVSRLLKRIVSSPEFVERHELEDLTYVREDMERLNRFVLTAFGAPWDHFRMDVSAHPFTVDLAGPQDVRITTWYHGRDFRRSLLAAVHEWGHALYELQQDPELCCTPVSGGVSLGIHESQSRFWENHIGRSLAFVETFFDAFRLAIPSIGAYDIRDVYKYFNLVRPELIRVEADEVSYILHIALRYELEVAVIDGDISVAELPAAWNERIEKYLGVTPPDDAHGVLQDIHWAMGAVGYFPTYALGTVLSAQIRHAMEKDIGPLDELIRGKHFGAIRDWLFRKVHRFGSVYPPRELVRRALGEDLRTDYFLSYAKEHYGSIYGVSK